ncbi:MAG: biotin attachment protein [Planctomycetes bacterium]|nr:biotin attachment protein [Planctomycetota bacterium]
MKYVVEHEGEEIELEVQETEDGGYSVLRDGRAILADFKKIEGSRIFSLIVQNKSFEVLIRQDGDLVDIVNHGRGLKLRVESERERNARLIAGEGGSTDGESIKAVMPGIVVAVNVAEGDEVTSGQAVCVLEAMKMENEIRSSVIGKVLKVAVAAGQTVNAGDLLVEIGPPE